MATAAEIATRGFEAISPQPLDAAPAVPKPGATDVVVDDREPAAFEGIREPGHADPVTDDVDAQLQAAAAASA